MLTDANEAVEVYLPAGWDAHSNGKNTQMLDRNRPPPKRQGYRWEYREGCRCKTCPWKGNCLGETWPHWIQVKETVMTETQKQIDRAMLEVTALSHIAKAEGDLPTYYAANRAWHQLFNAREDRSKRAIALSKSR